MTVPYVHSRFSRKEDDDYQTIDERCVEALLGAVEVPRSSTIIDCCSPNGSGIVTQLRKKGFSVSGVSDAFSDFWCDWVISNPPYKRGIVDKIIWKQIERVEKGSVEGVAMLLRANFDFAKSRYEMFAKNPFYFCQVKMLFRPLWVERKEGEKKVEPIHNFVWHIWRANLRAEPVVSYWKEG